MKTTRVGVVNWNATLPADGYFGRYATRSLQDERFRDRLPYYAQVSGGLRFPPITQELVDEQLRYAIDAGIDYFAYCFYTSTKIEAPACDVDKEADWNVLNAMRRLHETSVYRDKISLCAILRPSKMNPADYDALVCLMREPFYEKIDGRPLAYYFGGAAESVPAKATLEHAAEKAGVAKPYSVLFADKEPDAGFDALSKYTYCGTGERFEEVVDGAIAVCDKQKAGGLPVIPMVTTGWNPEPRVLHPVPWTSYSADRYAPPADPAGIRYMGEAYAAWIDANPDCTTTGHVLTFAWNEFEEGGFLCPTLGADGQPNTAVLDSFAKAVIALKSKEDNL